MDAVELRVALTQLVENYRRCGLTHLPKAQGDASPELLAALAHLNAVSSLSALAAGVKQVGSSPPAQNQTAAPVQSSEVPQRERPAAAVSAGSEIIQAESWSLPVLPTAERESRFQQLSQAASACRKCTQIVSYRQQAVFGSGNLQPAVCFVGEAPGADEDRQGVPFVGKAGQLLTKIITAMKLTRDEVYILNALKCRPPQNRTPVPDEIENCRGFLQSQLEILQPKFIVCLGAVAVRGVLQSQAPVGRLRGKLHCYRDARVVVTYHPSYLLRNADAKRLVWDDMKMLMVEMGIPV